MMKKKMRVLLSVVVAAASLFGFQMTALAGNSGTTPDGFSWVELSGGTIAVTGYSGSATALNIPGTIDGKSVTQIGNDSESGVFPSASFTSVTVPSGVKRICGRAFLNCASLSSVSLPASLKYINYATFEGCTSLTSVTLPSSLLSLGEGAFRRSHITKIVIPRYMTYIGPEAFAGCSNLTKCTVLSDTVQFDEQTNYPKYNGKIFAGSPMTDGIYGNNGSTAQTYAEGNSIPFYLLSSQGTISDPATGVQVAGSLPNGSTLAVTQVSADSEVYTQAQQHVGDNKLLLLFDISLMQGADKVQPNGNVTVTIPIPDEYKDADNLVVAYIDSSGTVTYLDCTIANGKISFVTNHFSSYALVQSAAATPTPSATSAAAAATPASTLDDIPQTGEGNSDLIWWILGGFSVLGLAATMLLYRKGISRNSEK